MQTKHIRDAFLDFFKERQHDILPSSSLIPHHDPSLLFVNAGMVQFKPFFTGEESPKGSHRAATSQKCVRAGGKHNDLDNVGYTARHHTFFEMLGNFSFGDYFKEDAIPFAWDFLTKTLKLPKEKLLVTIYHDDEEAYQLWKKVAGFSDDKIIRIATDDNFWSMGDVGPCGPCTEIFYDHGSHIPGGPPGSPEEDGDRFIEIWNLVFMQFESLADGTRKKLPKPSIDTGIGLERLAAVMQGKHNNYDIDLFQGIIQESVELTGKTYTGDHAVSHRVIADHLRSTSFLMADGVLPSNEGRGYVLRRIMRRAMRHAHLLQYDGALMSELVPALVGEMGQAFPELGRAQALITETLSLEEERFRSTLSKGLLLLSDERRNLASGDVLDGEVAFKLYDTYGFPLDLTSDILRTDNITIDHDGFDRAMEEQRTRARAAWSGSGEQKMGAHWIDVRERVGATEFLGYKQDEGIGEIQAIFVDDKEVSSCDIQGKACQFVVNQTPFYAESGGQIGDTGVLVKDGTTMVEIHDTKKLAKDLVVHYGTLVEGTISVGERVQLVIDQERRSRLKRNHSATHLLHMVLRKRLGDHVIQKGSLVAEDRLRFDFSHPKALSLEDIHEIELDVNRLILANTAVQTHLMQSDDAIKKGAMALFGEKYDDEVRVVSMGDEPSGGESVELCGGTHVSRTGDIGPFKITTETAIAAGVRRIEAITGDAVIAFIQDQERVMQEIQATLKVRSDDIVPRLISLGQERKRLEKALADTKKAALSGGSSGDCFTKEKIGSFEFWSQVAEGISVKDLRGMADTIRKQQSNTVIAMIGIDEEEGKASLIVAVTDDLAVSVSAVPLVQSCAELLGGKGGGGKPTLAQAGGPEVSKAVEVVGFIRNMLNA